MANTTNFGWETPDDTDLVKDGAAAMRTLGNSIDTSFVDLKGGTSGQILSKNSNTDLDFVWIANDQGDITAVTAGTGLTGGGTAGAVTLSLSTPVSATNGGTEQTTYTTGDILYASAANTLAKRSIGTTGQVLTVSGGIPTWAAPAGGGKILQVIQATTTTTTATSSTSFGDTALSASITPSATSSKVLVLLTQNTRIASITGSHNDIGGATRLMRGATVLLNQINGPSMYLGGLSPSGTEARHTITAAYLDSPATTSATTYKPQIKVNYTSTSYEAIEFQTIILMEVGA